MSCRSDIESRARAMVAYHHPIGFHLMNSPRDAEDSRGSTPQTPPAEGLTGALRPPGRDVRAARSNA
jgi:hypothetical protein